jgi:heme O synthase-like polyprenyltransferase
MPHFLAINWMYRDEYLKGGFIMTANEDASGRKTSGQALGYCVALALLGLVPWLASFAHSAYSIIGVAAGIWLVRLAWLFFQQPERSTARKLFFATLIYLPVALIALCLLRR